jgi:hypothetical protein
MKKIFVILVLVFVLVACAPSVNQIEREQQSLGNMAIVQNQPVPDLGGYSFERQIVIETYLARNNTISTFTYLFTFDGKIVEVCASIGYPIPYATQLTNPMKFEYSDGSPIPNAEPNSLYPPSSAAATLVQCVNSDGSVSPTYIEDNVMAFPYRIRSDFAFEKIGEPSFTVQVKP